MLQAPRVLRRALQLCKHVEHALCTLDLHVDVPFEAAPPKMCRPAVFESPAKAGFSMLTSAVGKGERPDRQAWAPIALYARGIQLQAERVMDHAGIVPEAMAASDQGQLLLQQASATCHQAGASDSVPQETWPWSL